VSWSIEDIKERKNLKATNPYLKVDLTGNTVISIDRVRELKNESKYAPYEGTKKVYILSDADKLTRESANSLLKLLEEPPENLLIIIITTSVKSILETIRSRCHMVYFPGLSYSEALAIVTKYRPNTEEVQRAVHIAQGNLKAIFQMLENNIEEKNKLFYEYLKAIAIGNPLTLMEIVDKLTKKRDKNFLMDILNLLMLWFEDVIHLQNFGIESEVINIDFKEELKRFTLSYHYSNFEGIIREIENALSKLHRNIYNPIILTVLAIRIKQSLIGQK
jgi:DNA polymerase-3 subunit delta'